MNDKASGKDEQVSGLCSGHFCADPNRVVKMNLYRHVGLLRGVFNSQSETSDRKRLPLLGCCFQPDLL